MPSGKLTYLLILTCCLILPSLHATQFRYVFPANISINFSEKVEVVKEKLKLSATIESKLGMLSDMEVYFSSSKDLKVISNTRTLKSLKLSAIRKVKILAVKTGQKPDEMGSWIKMGVRYLPDYKAILSTINESEQYPDQFERQRLIDIAIKNQAAGNKYNESTRYFIKGTEN